MKVALITEGFSEFRSLSTLYGQLESRSGNVFLAPLKINVSPDAAPRIIARECRSRLFIAQAKGADLAVILLDRERQERCAGLVAAGIERETQPLCTPLTVRVVLKDRQFENWLIADLGALRRQPRRFSVSAGTVRRVQPNKADACDGCAILEACAINDRYDKVRDSQAICAHMNIGAAARHSRSLRHFLHVVGDTAFDVQCRVPPLGPPPRRPAIRRRRT